MMARYGCIGGCEETVMTEWIDRLKLKQNTGNDAELAGEVLEIFKSQVETWGRMLDPMDEAERWADAAHTIKGAALGIGASQLAEACRAAETRGRAEPAPSRTQASLLINEIRDALLPTLEDVARINYEISVSGDFRESYDPNS